MNRRGLQAGKRQGFNDLDEATKALIKATHSGKAHLYDYGIWIRVAEDLSAGTAAPKNVEVYERINGRLKPLEVSDEVS
jgi:hypothetical protein